MSLIFCRNIKKEFDMKQRKISESEFADKIGALP